MEGILIEPNVKAIEDLLAAYKDNKKALEWYECHGEDNDSASIALGANGAYVLALRALGIDPAAIR